MFPLLFLKQLQNLTYGLARDSAAPSAHPLVPEPRVVSSSSSLWSQFNAEPHSHTVLPSSRYGDEPDDPRSPALQRSQLYHDTIFCRFLTAPPLRAPRSAPLKNVKGCDAVEGGISKAFHNRQGRQTGIIAAVPVSTMSASLSQGKRLPCVDGVRNLAGFKDLQVHSLRAPQIVHKVVSGPSVTSAVSKWGSFAREQPKQHQQRSTSSKWGAFVDRDALGVTGGNDEDDGFVTCFD
jgi:hypothetical protein